MLAEAAAHGFDLLPFVVLLAAAVIAVPLFKLLGLAGVPCGGPCDRAVRDRAVFRCAVDPPCSRTWRGDVPVRHRAGDAAIAVVGDARRDIRAGSGAGRIVHRAAHLRRIGARLSGGAQFFCGYRVRPHFDRDRDADARRTARARVAEGAARRVDPAAQGSGDRPVAGALEVDADTIVDIMADTRQRDRDRLAIEMVEDVYATRHLIRGNMPVSAAGDSKVSPKTD